MGERQSTLRRLAFIGDQIADGAVIDGYALDELEYEFVIGYVQQKIRARNDTKLAGVVGGYCGPGRYRHYKGGEYDVLGLAAHEEAKSTIFSSSGSGIFEGAEMRVIYRPLTPGSLLEGSPCAFWARKLEYFNAQVRDVGHECAGAMIPRFKMIIDQEELRT